MILIGKVLPTNIGDLFYRLATEGWPRKGIEIGHRSSCDSGRRVCGPDYSPARIGKATMAPCRWTARPISIYVSASSEIAGHTRRGDRRAGFASPVDLEGPEIVRAGARASSVRRVTVCGGYRWG